MAPRRADRLVDLEENAGAMSEITERNGSQSPLLRLPSEIRNRIYGYVLGGHHIHIFSGGRDVLWRSICVAPDSDRMIAQAIIAKTPKNNMRDIANRHRRCRSHAQANTSPARLELSLLVVCRDINREAALLPFQLNTFVFDDLYQSDSVGELARSLIPAQTHAINSISITPGHFIIHISGHIYCCRIKAFKGLQHLTILGAIWPKNHGDGYGKSMLLRYFRKTTESLKYFECKSAVVCILDEERARGHYTVSKECEAASRELERQLLLPWDEEAYQAGLAAERKGSLRKRKVQSYRV